MDDPDHILNNFFHDDNTKSKEHPEEPQGAGKSGTATATGPEETQAVETPDHKETASVSSEPIPSTSLDERIGTEAAADLATTLTM